MKTKYHIEITRKALQSHFSEKALETIIQANIKQDRIEYQLWHDHIHFDGSAFDRGFQYIAEQEKLAVKHLKLSEYDQARMSFGHITHSWQDFFSHSNYVSLWLCNHQNHPPAEITIDDPEIFHHPDLESGKNYGVIEFLAMLPLLSTWLKPLMPHDSHARMNLDDPSASPNFEYAYWAAYQSTVSAYEQLMQQLNKLPDSEYIISHFKDKQIGK